MTFEPALGGSAGIHWKLGTFFQAVGTAYAKVLSPEEELGFPEGRAWWVLRWIHSSEGLETKELGGLWKILV